MLFGTAVKKEADDRFPKVPVNVILIDHYDSFTYNLVDMLTQLCGKPPTVFPCDCADTWNELHAKFDSYDGIVLSPGPGHPKDCALALDCVAQNPNVPILGVCLGHQILGLAYNATVDLAPRPIHGQIQPIDILEDSGTTRNTTLFEGIDHLSVTRYHSLQVLLDPSTILKPTAISKDDNVVMAMKHTNRPHWGVQFHPESIGTSHGMNLLHNFVKECTRSSKQTTASFIPTTAGWTQDVRFHSDQARETKIWVHRVPNLPSNGANMKPPEVMNEILAADEFSYWLDHSDSTRLPGASILGSSTERIEYYGKEKSGTGVRTVSSTGDETFFADQNVLSYLEQHMPKNVDTYDVEFISSGGPTINEADEAKIPFTFRGGFVGYLGYEVRLDLAQPKQGCAVTQSSDPNLPTAAFLWADRSFVYDHETCQWYLVGVFHGNEDSAVTDWMISMSRRLQLGAGQRNTTALEKGKQTMTPLAFVARRSPETYAQNFDRCLHHINQGDSYELCLTNQLETSVSGFLKPQDLFNILRSKNPAPYSAFLNWGGRFAICSSSPERFLSVKGTPIGLLVEAKPIKGTTARVLPENGFERTEREQLLDRQRASNLQQSVKDRAENLMIVDLLRNDLSRVCQPGTVHVSKLMGIESYATVHQMVSTIRGCLNTSNNCIDVLRACFPGGSMTGAPKIRTMAILNELEEDVGRGPYSGCMGYLSLNGSMDMNILIRTAVLSRDECDWKVRIGAGGAITALSDRTAEFDEMMLKADVVMKSVQEWTSSLEAQGDVYMPTSDSSLRISKH